MSELKNRTTEQVLKAAATCPDARQALRELYPEAWEQEADEEEWEDVTQDCLLRGCIIDGFGRITIPVELKDTKVISGKFYMRKRADKRV